MITVYAVWKLTDDRGPIALFRSVEDLTAFIAGNDQYHTDLWTIPAETFEFEE